MIVARVVIRASVVIGEAEGWGYHRVDGENDI